MFLFFHCPNSKQVKSIVMMRGKITFISVKTGILAKTLYMWWQGRSGLCMWTRRGVIYGRRDRGGSTTTPSPIYSSDMAKATFGINNPDPDIYIIFCLYGGQGAKIWVKRGEIWLFFFFILRVGANLGKSPSSIVSSKLYAPDTWTSTSMPKLFINLISII